MRKKIDPDIRKITFTVSLAPALVRRIEAEAERLKISRSAAIRLGVEEWLSWREKHAETD